ncbi:hypothetical protein AB9E21_34830, partial [Rhizobium leguminosarum]
GGLVLDGTLQTCPNGNTAAYGPFPLTHSTLSSVPKPAGKFEVLPLGNKCARGWRHRVEITDPHDVYTVGPEMMDEGID